MDDLISRQAAFDAIAVLVKEVNSRKRIESVRGKEAIEILDKYAQQELFNNNNILRHPQCANRTKLGNCDPVGGFCTSVPKEICNAQAHDVLNDTDLISRQAAIDLIMGQPPEPHYPSWYAEQIRTLPLVLPEIIRCKECTWYHIVIEPQYVEYCELTECTVFRNDFCSRAERRNDE